MKTPAAEITEGLWTRGMSSQFQGGIRRIVESRKTAQEKEYALLEIARLAYKAGVDRGYDMAATIFGEGDDE